MTATADPRDTDGSGRELEYSGEEMSLYDHLDELRSRLFKSALAVAVGFAIGFAFRNPVFNLLKQPYCDLDPDLRLGSTAFDPERCQLIFTDVMGAFFISLKAAAVVAVVISGPVVFYQVWRFVTPGLRPVERRYALPFILISQMLFASGAVFSYVVIPRGLEFLLGFAGTDIVSLMDANRYLTFMLHVMIAFGLAFELPLILIMLTLMGVVSADGLRRYRRHALFGAFVAAAIITPTQDPLTMSLMAGPLVGFYEVSILVARVIERRRARAGAGV